MIKLQHKDKALFLIHILDFDGGEIFAVFFCWKCDARNARPLAASALSVRSSDHDQPQIFRTFSADLIRHPKRKDLRTLEGRVHDSMGVLRKQVREDTDLHFIILYMQFSPLRSSTHRLLYSWQQQIIFWSIPNSNANAHLISARVGRLSFSNFTLD